MGEILDQKDQRGVKASLLKDLDLEQVLCLPHVFYACFATYLPGCMSAPKSSKCLC